MSKEKLLKQYDALLKKLYAYRHAMTLIGWDNSTFAPKNAVKGIGIASSLLQGEYHKIMTNQETIDLIGQLREEKELDKVSKASVEEFYRDQKKLICIPKEEVMEFAKLQAECESVWKEARKNNDFNMFVPNLKKMIEFTKRFAKYYAPEEKAYNTLLDDYQKGLKMETADKFFAEIEKSVVPLNAFVANSKKIAEAKKIQERMNSKIFKTEDQVKLIDRLFELQGLDPNRCKIAKSTHPFTTGTNSQDVRYTVRYLEDNLATSIFAALHEGGHAMYMLNTNPDFDFTPLAEGTSATMHESQSRIYENNMGRNKHFNKHIYDIVKDIFPEEMSDVSSDDFYLYSNVSSPSFIRVEADELTYSLHIMVRYHIEKMIFEQDLPVEKLPEVWNEMYQKYLGITPTNLSEGVLQDVHWAFGLFGYFPTYCLGTAVSCQFEDAMKKSLDFDGALKKGDLTEITKWLKDNVQQYGKLYDDDTIIKKATGKEFDPKFYAKYLDNKYRGIYG